MSLRIVYEHAEQLSLGVWRVPIPPSELTHLGPSMAAGPGRSVIVASAPPTYDAEGQMLSVTASPLLVAHQGDPETAEVIVVCTITSHGKEEPMSTPEHQRPQTNAPTPKPKPEPQLAAGDREFLIALGRDRHVLSAAGRRLLHEIRTFYKVGALEKKGRRFVETPDNFWTVTIQPRAQSLRISVYGTSAILHAPAGITWEKAPRPGYSEFLIHRDSQIEGAVQIIRQAYEAKMSKLGRRP